MTPRLEPSDSNATKRLGTLALTLLVLGGPALASISVDCDDTRFEARVSVTAPVANLHVELVDHGMTSVDSDISAINNPAVNVTVEVNSISAPSAPDASVQRMFTHAQESFENTATDVIYVSEEDVASGGSTEGPAAANGQDEASRTNSVTTNNTTTPVVDTQLPGVSDADLVRFRRQMYRTDI